MSHPIILLSAGQYIFDFQASMNRIVFVEACAIKLADAPCDLGFVPPMTRRRFSPLQKVAFALLNAVDREKSELKMVFASRDGELKLTHDIVEAFNADASVSPWKFSSSVYNAAPGLYSVFSSNHSTYTAIAACDETIENSLIEALMEDEVLWCYAEEEGEGLGAAMRIGSGSGGGDRIALEDGDFSLPPIGFEDLCAFLEKRTSVLAGKRISLRRLP
jgi:hypothetical protein